MKFSHPHFQSTEYEERNILKRTWHSITIIFNNLQWKQVGQRKFFSNNGKSELF